MRTVGVAGLIAILTACGNENQVTQLCGTPTEGFDIEEASVLQDAQSYPEMHDAVILDFDQELAAGAAWRVSTVEIMPMIGDSNFDFYQDGEQVTVEVWDADNPEGEPWTVTQTFRIDDLAWDETELSSPESATELDQHYAWWSFDFSDVIPTSGMSGPEYLVSVNWSSAGSPPLGYSNFNRPCDENWTDYADGAGWVLNGDASGDTCSWPMLRVGLEVLTEDEFCADETVSVDE